MRDDLLARFKLLSAALVLTGCTSTLDFESVTKGGGDSGDGDGDGAGDGDAASFACDDIEPKPTFCDDFDGSDVEEVWEQVVIAPDTLDADDVGVLKNDGTAAVSGDHSLLAIMNEGVKGDYVAVAAVQSFEEFAGEPIHAEIDFEMRVEQIDPTKDHYATAFQLLFGNDNNYSQLVLSLVSKGTDVSSRLRENIGATCPDDGCTVDHAFKNVPDLGEWAHVSFVLDLKEPGGTDNRATLTVDDTVLFDGKLSLKIDNVNPRIELGIPWIAGQGDDKLWRVRYDNLLVNITKE